MLSIVHGSDNLYFSYFNLLVYFINSVKQAWYGKIEFIPIDNSEIYALLMCFSPKPYLSGSCIQTFIQPKEVVPMKYELFEYILTVAKHRSISKAAEELYMSHSALSIAISNFESEIGFRIFDRTTKGISLTEKGRIVIKHITEIVKEYGSIKALAPSPEKKALTIASVATISNNILTEVFDLYTREFPHISLNTSEMEPQDVGNAVAYDHYDIGLSFIESERLSRITRFAAEHDLEIRHLLTDNFYLYVNKESPLLLKDKVVQADLADCTFLSTNHRHNKLKNDIYSSPIDARYALSFSNQEVLKKYIVESSNKNCVAWLPKLLSYNDYYVKSGAIVPVNVADYDCEIRYYLMYDPDNDKESLILNFAEIVYDIIEKALTNTPESPRQ